MTTMRKKWHLTFSLAALCLMSLFLGACENKGSQQTENQIQEREAPAEIWKDTEYMARVIDQHFKENSVKKGLPGVMPIKDQVTKSERYMGIKKTLRDTLYRINADEIVMGTLMREGGLEHVVDFKMIWDKKLVNQDSTYGGLKVNDVFIRHADGKSRYRWEKAGEYWERINTQLEQ
ncbi:hypothetical protein [Hugenholtzia roseola]|uniref:hypothetical protein n=1 Tax=Hugenholtzia roseola TaxID=1002 RepID=UPI0004066DA3|nr:hypothetical protein [Hugenholtzia roseola]